MFGNAEVVDIVIRREAIFPGNLILPGRVRTEKNYNILKIILQKLPKTLKFFFCQIDK